MFIEFKYIVFIVGIIVLLKIVVHMYFDSVDQRVQKGINTKGAAGIGGRYLFPIPKSDIEKRNRVIKIVNTLYVSIMIFYIVILLFRQWLNLS